MTGLHGEEAASQTPQGPGLPAAHPAAAEWPLPWVGSCCLVSGL